MRTIAVSGAALALAVLLGSSPLQAASQPKLMVAPLAAERGVDEGLLRLLNELLLTEFQKSGTFEVIGGSDIVDMLEHEQQKQLAGCDDEDTSCWAQIGGALGVDVVAKANIGRIGEAFLLNIKILDVKSASVLARWSEHVEGEEDELVAAIRSSVSRVIEDARPRLLAGNGGDPADSAADPSTATTAHAGAAATPGLAPLPFYIAAGSAATLAVGTLVLEVLVQGQINTVDENPADTAARDRGKKLQTAEWVFFATTGVALATTGVLFALTDFDSAEEPGLQVAPVATPEGAMISIVGGF